MRTFKKYAPMQIAKYVSAFFKGNFYIQGIGMFSFDGVKSLSIRVMKFPNVKSSVR